MTVFVGASRVFSVAMLTCSIVIVFCSRSSISRALGRSGIVFVLMVSYYLIVGLASRFSQPGNTFIDLDWQELALMFVPSLTIVVAFACGTFYLYRSERWRPVLKYLLGIALIPVIFCYVSFFWDDWSNLIQYEQVTTTSMTETVTVYSDIDQGRTTGLFSNPNDAAAEILLALIMALSYFLMRKRGAPLLAIVVLCLMAIILTFSRAGILVAFAVIGLAILSSDVRGMGLRQMFGLIFLLAAVAAVGWVAIGSDYFRVLSRDGNFRLDSLVALVRDRDFSDENTGERLDLATLGVQHWGQAFFLGNGVGYMRRMPGVGQGVHNTILLVAGDAGVGAFILMCAFIVVFLKESLQAGDRSIRIFALSYWFVFVGCCLVSHNVLEDRQQNMMIGICFGLLAAGQRGMEPKMRVRALPVLESELAAATSRV